MHNLQELRDDEFIHVDTHVSTTGIFDTSETRARGTRHGVGGIPDAWFDGLVRVTGAGSCASAQSQYNTRINSRISATGGLSPIDIDVTMSIAGSMATITGTADLVDNMILNGLQMTLFLVEGTVSDVCCDSQGNSTWYDITRSVRSNPIALTFGGTPAEVTEVIDFSSLPAYSGPPVNAQELYAVAVVEYAGGTEEVFQAARYRNDLRVNFDQQVASAPQGNGEILVSGTIVNGNEDADDFDVSAAGDRAWNYAFQLDGDPTWHQNTSISLAAGEEMDFTIRVNTDDSYGVGAAQLDVDAQSSSFATSGILRVFNNSYACMMVDADNNGNYEIPFQEALTNLGQIYDDHVATSGNGPLAASMAGYDLVVWETGYISNPMKDDRGLALQSYLNSGGNLLLESMDFTGSQANTPALRDLLGVASYTVNSRADEANGIGGDPISDGTAYTLTFPTQSANRVDTVNPTASAATVFENESAESNVIRNSLTGGNRVVYSTIEQGAYDGATSSVDVAEAMIAWLLSSVDPTDVEESSPFVSRMLDVYPNPSTTQTGIGFALSDFAAQLPVSLKVVDASGREVRSLYNGRLEAGSHSIEWDGRDESGNEVANGLYFAKLNSADGELRTKMVRLR